MKTLTSKVTITDNDKMVSEAYDYQFTGISATEIHTLNVTELPDNFGIGLIVGQSGSGKSTNLKNFGACAKATWDNELSVVSNFEDYTDASKRLHGCGLNSIRCWTQSFNTLSTGQAYRANMARTIKDGAVYDEFASYLDENTAKSLSNSIRRYVDMNNISGVVLATCRRDVIEWLRPDWVFDTDSDELIIGRLERRPSINLEVSPCSVQIWERFKNHHYLSGSINKGSRCWVATWGDDVVGFYATLAQPSGTLKNAWRGTRMVVLPEFQGLGISTALCETVAQIHLDSGKRFFAKTASNLLGEHREKSDKWKPTSKNKKRRKDYLSGRDNKFSKEHKAKHANRLTYSHEFLGEPNAKTT